MNNSCCQVDSICHVETSDFYSLIENIVNLSVNNTQWSFITFLMLFIVLFLYVLYMINKDREYQNSISSEISKLNQTLKCSINSSIRCAFDEFSGKYDKSKDCELSRNENLMNVYFSLIKIHGNIDLCYNSLNNIDYFIDEFFKFQSNYRSAVILLHSVQFSENNNICKLLVQFETIAQKIFHEHKNFPNHKYDKEIEEILQKCNNYVMVLKDLLNLR